MVNAFVSNILNQVNLGSFYYEIAILLRESLLINGILFNIEASYGLTENDIKELEKVELILMRKILKAHSKTPNEAIYLELGVLPLKYIIMSRKVMFLHYILTRDRSELLSRFFYAQLENPAKNDWTEEVKETLKELNITLTFSEIQSMKKDPFQKHVKMKVKEAAFKALMNMKESHSKMDNLTYKKLDMKSYLKCSSSFSKKASSLFRYRTNMADVKINFKNKYSSFSLLCPMGCEKEDSQLHLLECECLVELVVCPWMLGESAKAWLYKASSGASGLSVEATISEFAAFLYLF